jgi:Spy/CpxP family protein refolding chaperone
MKRIALTFLALGSAASLFAPTADPGAADKSKLPSPPRAPMKHFFWDRLNLTDDQKEKLKQIREADRDGLGSAWAQVKIAQESLHAALLANPENTADIQAKATDLATALSTKSVQFALHEARVNQVLTPQQRVFLDEAKKNRMNRWHRHQGGNRQQARPWERGNQHSTSPAPAAGVTPEPPTN